MREKNLTKAYDNIIFSREPELMDLAVNDCISLENKFGISFADNKVEIKGKDIVIEHGDLTMRILDADDYTHFLLGRLTHCDYGYGRMAESSLAKTIAEPFAGALVIEKDGEIVAQSFVWTDESKDTFVFDNMEFSDDRTFRDYRNIIADYCEALPYKNVHMGTGYNRQMNDWGKQIENPVKINSLSDNNFRFYSNYYSNARSFKTNGIMGLKKEAYLEKTFQKKNKMREKISNRFII